MAGATERFVLVLALAAATALAGTATVLSALTTHMAANPNILAATVVTQSSTSTTSFSTQSIGTTTFAAVGSRNPVTGDPFFPDTSVRANSGLGELCVAVLAHKLIALNLLPQLGESIPPRLLPGGLQFLNPKFQGVPISLKMLLTHTSSLIDINDNLITSPSVSGGSNAQVSLRDLCQSYFLSVGTSGSSSVSTSIWSSRQPGLTGSYQFARSNILLLAFIVEQSLAENPTLVASSQKTVGAYMQEAIFASLGMSNTFFVLPDGSLPLLSGGGGSPFSSKMAAEFSTTSATPLSFRPIVAGYVSDFMLRSTASDVNKLIRALFMDTTSQFYTIGTLLLGGMITVTETSATRVGITKQGYGVVAFDPAVVCAAGASVLSLPAGCSITSSSLFGIAGVGSNSALTSICTANINGLGMTCTTSAYSYRGSATTTFSSSNTLSSTGFVAGVAALNDVFIDASVTDGDTVTPVTQSTTALFGFEVFLGVLGSTLGVLMLAYMGEYIMHPLPLVGAISNKSYPTLGEHVDRTAALMRRRQKEFDTQ